MQNKLKKRLVILSLTYFCLQGTLWADEQVNAAPTAPPPLNCSDGGCLNFNQLVSQFKQIERNRVNALSRAGENPEKILKAEEAYKKDMASLKSELDKSKRKIQDFAKKFTTEKASLSTQKSKIEAVNQSVNTLTEALKTPNKDVAKKSLNELGYEGCGFVDGSSMIEVLGFSKVLGFSIRSEGSYQCDKIPDGIDESIAKNKDGKYTITPSLVSEYYENEIEKLEETQSKSEANRLELHHKLNDFLGQRTEGEILAKLAVGNFDSVIPQGGTTELSRLSNSAVDTETPGVKIANKILNTGKFMDLLILTDQKLKDKIGDNNDHLKQLKDKIKLEFGNTIIGEYINEAIKKNHDEIEKSKIKNENLVTFIANMLCLKEGEKDALCSNRSNSSISEEVVEKLIEGNLDDAKAKLITPPKTNNKK